MFNAIREVVKREGTVFSDLEVVRTWLSARSDCTGAIGVIGFCFGGGVAVLLAGMGGYDASSVNYGAVPKDAFDLLENACPIVASYGADDISLRKDPHRLREVVEAKLDEWWSPAQISSWLVDAYPGDEEMRVSHETIYQSLYVQGRGALRKELWQALRTGRARRRPQGRPGSTKGQIRDMVMISERPAEVEDRAVPGHWEGDLIMGTRNTAIGTLVERWSRYVMLFRVPKGNKAEDVRVALTATIKRLPNHLWQSLTWDQGTEMAQHAAFTIDTGIQVFFCDPKSPWQRGSNENTNGLLRQYFPKGTDLSVHSQEQLDIVARELNERPRMTLNYCSPAEKFEECVASIG